MFSKQIRQADQANSTVKSLSRKVTTYVATYTTLKKAANKVANSRFHVLSLDADNMVTPSYIVTAARQLVSEGRERIPGVRAEMQFGQDHPEERLNLPNWAWVPMKGINTFVQVKTTDRWEIEFRCATRAGLEQVERAIAQRVSEADLEPTQVDFDPFGAPTHTRILTWNSEMSEWHYARQRVARSFASVVLPVELQQQVEDDLTRFSDSQARLKRVEMPWRRGYLLAGPPGTGKTSVSLAIAGCLDFGVARLSLTDVQSDGELVRAVSSLSSRNVLVLEDIDAYSISHDRDHNAARDGAVSLSGLLNALDGFETPEGLVTIVTSNHPERLDPALVRSGRIDRHFTLDYIMAPELVRLYRWFYEDEAPGLTLKQDRALVDAKISPSDVAEQFKQHLEDGPAGWDAVLKLVDSRAPLSGTELRLAEVAS